MFNMMKIKYTVMCFAKIDRNVKKLILIHKISTIKKNLIYFL